MPHDADKPSESAPGVAAKVAFLARPESYPTRPQRVEVIETHMAWVFLTDRHAYKLKKPVRYDYLDFSTLEARRWDGTEEVRLNRRLAADVYHGIVPLTITPQGALQLAGHGDVVDWLVAMRRLPSERMLDRAIEQATVDATEARKVGELLARFYLQTPPVAITPAVYRQCLASSVRENRDALMAAGHALPAVLVESVTGRQLALLERQPELFTPRVRAGRIIEAHGDLRPEHICLEPQPVIIDCLEFNRDFRILDAVSELMFLALECVRLGAPNIGEAIVQRYTEATSDAPPEPLRRFYTCYHACIRAKIALWHLADVADREAPRWIDKATYYLRQAHRAAHGLPRQAGS
jgi:aminoglycoside phosphotransferase family enzyme